ncbi:MAG: undecaprenyl-diphosphatase UppP [Acidobacteria bacterium]|nr:undecaprenyl-diphosphatase UppP [Acidobacteriota bacterium]MBK8150351.1 undecaprenyl-diphosphatase UppP [Acidobacteriota bacterium]MBK8811351.1 undecaprenyl-diphosphatase UppP [Acidobacteriota bacterium]
MNLLQAIILGIVQGLTEFIPISSTAHLVFASRVTDVYGGNPEQITATMAVIQLGTLAAVFVYFASDIWEISSAFVRDHVALLTNRRGLTFSGTNGVRPMWLSEEAWLGWLIIIGSIPIGTVGLAFKKVIEGPATKNLWVIATMMIVIAVGLFFAESVGKQERDLKQFGLIDALAVGFAQVLSLIPGASRSGSTIMGGLFAGQMREAAARFSFLLMIPAITASGLLELKEAIDKRLLSSDEMVALAVGTLAAAVVGYLSIWFLLAFLRKRSTGVFVVYRLIVGVVILVLLWKGVISPQV